MYISINFDVVLIRSIVENYGDEGVTPLTLSTVENDPLERMPCH